MATGCPNCEKLKGNLKLIKDKLIDINGLIGLYKKLQEEHKDLKRKFAEAQEQVKVKESSETELRNALSKVDAERGALQSELAAIKQMSIGALLSLARGGDGAAKEVRNDRERSIALSSVEREATAMDEGDTRAVEEEVPAEVTPLVPPPVESKPAKSTKRKAVDDQLHGKKKAALVAAPAKDVGSENAAEARNEEVQKQFPFRASAVQLASSPIPQKKAASPHIGAGSHPLFEARHPHPIEQPKAPSSLSAKPSASGRAGESATEPGIAPPKPVSDARAKRVKAAASPRTAATKAVVARRCLSSVEVGDMLCQCMREALVKDTGATNGSTTKRVKKAACAFDSSSLRPHKNIARLVLEDLEEGKGSRRSAACAHIVSAAIKECSGGQAPKITPSAFTNALLHILCSGISGIPPLPTGGWEDADFGTHIPTFADRLRGTEAVGVFIGEAVAGLFTEDAPSSVIQSPSMLPVDDDDALSLSFPLLPPAVGGEEQAKEKRSLRLSNVFSLSPEEVLRTILSIIIRAPERDTLHSSVGAVGGEGADEQSRRVVDLDDPILLTTVFCAMASAIQEKDSMLVALCDLICSSVPFSLELAIVLTEHYITASTSQRTHKKATRRQTKSDGRLEAKEELMKEGSLLEAAIAIVLREQARCLCGTSDYTDEVAATAVRLSERLSEVSGVDLRSAPEILQEARHRMKRLQDPHLRPRLLLSGSISESGDRWWRGTLMDALRACEVLSLSLPWETVFEKVLRETFWPAVLDCRKEYSQSLSTPVISGSTATTAAAISSPPLGAVETRARDASPVRIVLPRVRDVSCSCARSMGRTAVLRALMIRSKGEDSDKLSKLEMIAETLQKALPIQERVQNDENIEAENRDDSPEIRSCAYFPLDVEGAIAEGLAFMDVALSLVDRKRSNEKAEHPHKWLKSLDAIAQLILPDGLEETLAAAEAFLVHL